MITSHDEALQTMKQEMQDEMHKWFSSQTVPNGNTNNINENNNDVK